MHLRHLRNSTEAKLNIWPTICILPLYGFGFGGGIRSGKRTTLVYVEQITEQHTKSAIGMSNNLFSNFKHRATDQFEQLP